MDNIPICRKPPNKCLPKELISSLTQQLGPFASSAQRTEISRIYEVSKKTVNCWLKKKFNLQKLTRKKKGIRRKRALNKAIIIQDDLSQQEHKNEKEKEHETNPIIKLISLEEDLFDELITINISICSNFACMIQDCNFIN